MIAKDNIDLNSSSNTATMDYHGTGFSLMQMGAVESQDSYQLSYAMDTNFRSFKLNLFPRNTLRLVPFSLNNLFILLPNASTCLAFQA